MQGLLESRPKLHTAEDLFAYSEQGRYELVQGELEPMSPTGEAHGNVTILLSYYLVGYIVENRLGRPYAAETGFRIASDPDTVLAPDFAFVSRERLTGETVEGYPALIPDLVLETRSPGDTRAAIARKVKRWLEAGTRMVLELDPKRRVLTVYRPGSGPRRLEIAAIFDGEDVLPGLRLPVQNLFPTT